MISSITVFERFMKDYRYAHPGNVDQASAVLKSAIQSLLEEHDRLRGRLGPLADPICLLGGEKAPCMTEEQSIAEGNGPGIPCTFDPSPKEVLEYAMKKRQRVEELEVLLAQALDALKYHLEQTRPIEKTTLAIEALTRALGLEGGKPV